MRSPRRHPSRPIRTAIDSPPARRYRRLPAGVVAAAVALAVVPFVAAAPAAAASTGAPWGHLNRVPVAFSVAHLTGTAIDPDTRHPIRVTVTLDGHPKLTVIAQRWNAAVARNHPRYGGWHGFDVHLPIPDGRHRVCVVADNVGRGHNTWLGCAGVLGRNNPTGAITAAGHTAAGVTLAGWALDPDLAAPTHVAVSLDGARPISVLADRAATLPPAWAAYGRRHGFAVTVPATRFGHTVCVTAVNRGAGTDTKLGCRTLPVVITAPSVPQSLTSTATTTTITVSWAAPADDGGDPVTGYQVTGDGITTQLLPAEATGETLSGLPPATNFRLSVAAVNAIGTGGAATTSVRTAGSAPSAPQDLTATTSTGSVTLRWGAPADTGELPLTGYRILRRGAPAVSTSPTATSATISGLRPAVGYRFSVVSVNEVGPSVPAAITARTAGSVPSVPRRLTGSSPTSTTITLRWIAPADSGDGLPVTSYRITRRGVAAVTRPAWARSATIRGLKPSRWYRFNLTARNVLGASRTATVTVRTAAAIPAQTSPAPVSTSHYLRSLTGVPSHDLALMRAMGATDAGYNPSGHRYLVLLHMGGQSGGGAILSATTRWISYSAQVAAVDAYIDGYVSRRKANAPVLIAVSTNNDGTVSRWTGAAWANAVVDPIARHAARYRGVAVAGGSDMEPGFVAGPGASRAWLSGYLASTRARFVFVGSADGCPLSRAGRCNNHWTTNDLHYLSGGAAPGRIIAMPQIYNTAMPLQWHTISANGPQKVMFGGPLTEWTACAQARSCYSEPNVSAWRLLFRALAADRRTKMFALPYGTDLRIN